MDKVVTTPSADDIRQAIAEFDFENKILEEALRELFQQYSHNAQPAQVLLKVTALNTLYSTQIPLYNVRIPTIFDVTNHIVNLNIDSDLERGNDELVRRIAKTELPPKAVRFNYSFATKYCSWHNPNAYPIFDSHVYAYLCHLVNHDCVDRFRQNDCWDYPKFKKIIDGFQERNRLGAFTFKEIDKFLYLQGRILVQNKETEPVETEPTLVAVPSQPGEMEWSIENYSTSEEAEQSRERWTNSGGWEVIKPEMGTRKNGPESVLEVGAEGGTLAIVRQRNQYGTWEYWCLRDEMTISELLPEDESVNRDDLFEKFDHEDTFEDALLRLDQYPWFHLLPLKVHPDFADLVLREVGNRGGIEAAVEWTERLKDHIFDS